MFGSLHLCLLLAANFLLAAFRSCTWLPWTCYFLPLFLLLWVVVWSSVWLLFARTYCLLCWPCSFSSTAIDACDCWPGPSILLLLLAVVGMALRSCRWLSQLWLALQFCCDPICHTGCPLRSCCWLRYMASICCCRFPSCWLLWDVGGPFGSYCWLRCAAIGFPPAGCFGMLLDPLVSAVV